MYVVHTYIGYKNRSHYRTNLSQNIEPNQSIDSAQVSKNSRLPKVIRLVIKQFFLSPKNTPNHMKLLLQFLKSNKMENVAFCHKTSRWTFNILPKNPLKSVCLMKRHCSGSRLYDLWFFPIFSFKQTRGGSYHRSYKLEKERVSLSPIS